MYPNNKMKVFFIFNYIYIFNVTIWKKKMKIEYVYKSK